MGLSPAGHKRFIDLHAASVNGGLLLPLHLGWWNFQQFNPPQVEPTYPDVIEYLGAKLIGWDAGISLTGGIDPARLAAVPLFGRAVEILRTCEELRRGNTFDETIKAQLRQAGREFSLVRDDSGKWRFHPSVRESHVAAAAEPWSLSWTVDNPFAAQPATLRLEALMTAGSYDDPNNVVLADLSEPDQFAGTPRTADGVTASLSGSTGVFTATNSGAAARNAAWARLDRKLEPCLNVKGREAIGVWVEGDGQGQVLAVRLESPRHIAFGAVADRYITVDFTGRRHFTLVETESTRWSDYVWNDGKGHYNVYRENVDFGVIESVSLWFNNLPQGREVRCVIGPVKALPMVACTVKNPAVTINGRTVVFPVEMPSGSYFELDARSGCILYGPKGELIANVSPEGPVPMLLAGENRIGFSSDATEGPAARARLTIITQGLPL